MGRRANLTPKKLTDRNLWMVSVPPAFTESGSRERSYFKKKKDADDFAAGVKERVRSHGEAAGTIKASLAESAVACEEMLRPYGITLREAVERVVAQEASKAASATLDAASRAYELEKEHLASGKKIERAMAALREDFPVEQVAAITTAQIKRHLDERVGGNREWNNRRGILVAFWNWCDKRRWCDGKTASRLDTRDVQKKDTEVLKPDECKALLRAAEEHHPDCVPALVLALFAGLRVAEVERLEVAAIRRQDIVVSRGISKTGKSRTIHITPQVKDWLRAYPITGRETVIPGNWLRKYRAVRRLAGWKVWTDLVEPNEPPDDLPAWKQNAMRHTAPSVHVRLGKPLDVLIFEHGHRGNEQTLKEHYLAPLELHEAKKIAALRPLKRPKK